MKEIIERVCFEDLISVLKMALTQETEHLLESESPLEFKQFGYLREECVQLVQRIFNSIRDSSNLPNLMLIRNSLLDQSIPNQTFSTYKLNLIFEACVKTFTRHFIRQQAKISSYKRLYDQFQQFDIHLYQKLRQSFCNRPFSSNSSLASIFNVLLLEIQIQISYDFYLGSWENDHRVRELKDALCDFFICLWSKPKNLDYIQKKLVQIARNIFQEVKQTNSMSSLSRSYYS